MVVKEDVNLLKFTFTGRFSSISRLSLSASTPGLTLETEFSLVQRSHNHSSL